VDAASVYKVINSDDDGDDDTGGIWM